MSIFKRYPVIVLDRAVVEDYLKAARRTAKKVGATFSEVAIKNKVVSGIPADRSIKIEKVEADVIPRDVPCKVETSVLSWEDSYSRKIPDLMIEVKKENEEPSEITHQLVGYLPDHFKKRESLFSKIDLKKEDQDNSKCCNNASKNIASVSVYDKLSIHFFVKPGNLHLNKISGSSVSCKKGIGDTVKFNLKNFESKELPESSGSKPESSLQRKENFFGHEGSTANFKKLSVLSTDSVQNDEKRDDCSTVFERKYGLKDHLHSYESPINCNHCHGKFKSRRCLDKHLKVQSHENPYQCSVFSKTFKHSSVLNTHLMVHSDKFKCNQCSAAFRTKGHLKVHLMVHSSDNPYKSHQCPAESKRNSTLKDHVRVQSSDASFKRNQCLKLFSNSSSLKYHLSVHTDERPFNCTQCLKKFRRSVDLRLHERVHSCERPFKCSQCSAAFKWRSGLKKHMNRHLKTPDADKRFECNECLKKFKTRDGLIDHFIVHKSEIPFACRHCPSNFKRKSALVKHLKLHSYEKAFKCIHCSKAFHSTSNLNSHLKLHTDERPFKCELCPAKFKRKYSLNRHRKFHAVMKDYNI